MSRNDSAASLGSGSTGPSSDQWSSLLRAEAIVVVRDYDQRVLFMTPQAEALTGWCRQSAEVLCLQDVLINAWRRRSDRHDIVARTEEAATPIKFQRFLASCAAINDGHVDAATYVVSLSGLEGAPARPRSDGASLPRAGHLRELLHDPLGSVVGKLEHCAALLASGLEGAHTDTELRRAVQESCEALAEARVAARSFARRLSEIDAEASPVEPISERLRSRGVQKTRVLVVDDDEMMGRTLERVLGDTCEVHVETCALRALERLQSGSVFEILLCDATTPIMAGHELYRRLGSICPGMLSRIAFISGGVLSQEMSVFLKTWRGVLIEKPFDATTIRNAVTRVLQWNEGL